MAGETVLVVDDNVESLHFIVQDLLRSNGYVPLVATDGRLGLEMALHEEPDLMILDFRVPEMSGLEVLRALRERQNDMPVIFITAYGSEEEIVTAFRLGVKDYFRKPFDAQEMLDTIERVLSEHRQQEQQSRHRRELDQYIKELGALYGSSLERVLNRIVEAAVAITDAEEGYLLLIDEETNELYMRSALNVGERFASGFRLKIEDSIAGRVVRTGQPVRYNHLDEADRFKVKTGYLVKALINVPLRGKERVIGVLGVDNKHSSNVFSREDMHFLSTLADHAVTAIENAGLYERTHRALLDRIEELDVLQEVTNDLNATLDMEQIASAVLRHAVRKTSAEAGLVGLHVDGYTHWVSWGYIQQSKWEPKWDAGIIGEAARSGSPVLVPDLARSFDRVHSFPKTRAQLVVPILRGERAIGVIDLESSRPNAFTEHDMRFLQAVANHAAVAVENARLFDIVIGEQGKTRFILQSIADGVYTVDSDLCIMTFNPAAERMTGWREAEVLGKPCALVFRDLTEDGHSYQASLIERALECGQAVESAPDAPPITTREGRQVFVASHASPIRNREGYITGAVVTFRDVSAERELDRLKSDFISMVSHELRAPLANLGVAIELMLNSSQEHESLQEMLRIAHDSVQRLTRLVKDILNVSQIEAGQIKMQIEPVTLIPLVRRAIRVAQSQTTQHRIILQAPDDIPFVMADQNKLEIVLDNLLTNAIKYSPDGGRILVRISPPAEGEIVISVIDEGIGIPEEHVEKIFDRFYRVDTSDGCKVYGHGLGLYIARRFVELQEGRIWVQSRKSVGSCFSFTLPTVDGTSLYQVSSSAFEKLA